MRPQCLTSVIRHEYGVVNGARSGARVIQIGITKTMLKIKHSVLPSPIHGIGLFAAEFIPSGSVIFEEEEWLTARYPESVVDQMPADTRDFIIFYGYLRDGVYRLSIDADRFINHSDLPNTVESADNRYTFARRDIQSGEEITADYNSFCDNKWP